MFQIVIWDYYQRSKGKKLFNQNETLEEAQLTMDQEVLCCLYFFSRVLNYWMFSLKSLTRHLIVACFVVTIACIFFLCGLFYMPSVLWYQIVKFNRTDCCNPTMCFLPACRNNLQAKANGALSSWITLCLKWLNSSTTPTTFLTSNLFLRFVELSLAKIHVRHSLRVWLVACISLSLH